MAAARPDARSSLGRRPRQERDDREGRVAHRSGRDGARGVPQTGVGERRGLLLQQDMTVVVCQFIADLFHLMF